jgi:oxygen-independent coproporphyrinogen-3 oxidase
MHRIDGYVDALCREIELRKDQIDALEAIYIGGGTPSILEEKHFRQIMSEIRSCCSIGGDAEITAESNPGTLTDARISAMIESDVNRLSIGIQSFNDEELAILGRMHNAEEAVSAFKAARRGGFTNLSIDLIYGLPGQPLGRWEETLGKALTLHPEHISAYELTPERHTPLFDRIETGDLQLPDEDIIAEMYYSSIDTLGQGDYGHYEISNFAQPGRRCRHNLNYWDRGEYLGIGAGAHSFIEGSRISNVADIDKYISDVNRNVIPVADEIKLNETDELKEILFLGLRKTVGIDLNLIQDDKKELMKEALQEMSRQGLVELSDNRLKLTRKGLLLCNEVIVRLLLRIERTRRA